MEPCERPQSSVPGTTEHGRERADHVRGRRRHVLLPLGGVRADGHRLRADRAGLRPADEAARQPARVRAESARQPVRRRADVSRELSVDAPDRLVRAVVRGDPFAARQAQRSARRRCLRRGRRPRRPRVARRSALAEDLFAVSDARARAHAAGLHGDSRGRPLLSAGLQSLEARSARHRDHADPELLRSSVPGLRHSGGRCDRRRRQRQRRRGSGAIWRAVHRRDRDRSRDPRRGQGESPGAPVPISRRSVRSSTTRERSCGRATGTTT